MKVHFKNQKGFTLIEIIAVLIILGVLSAVAVPKFIDLVSESERKAEEGALAAAMSTLSMQYSKYLLKNSVQPKAGQLVKVIGKTPGSAAHPEGDYEYRFANKGSSQVVVSTRKKGTKTWASSKTWNIPQ